MNIAVSPQTIPMSWQDYLARNYDHTQIPWPRYRYSGTGVVEVTSEVLKNGVVARCLARRLEPFVSDPDQQILLNILGVEVERSEREERIPDLAVISEELADLIDFDNSSTLTLDMPSPLLVVEVVSPSSVKDVLETKPFEYMDRSVGEYVSIDWRKEIVQVWSCIEDGKNYNFSEYRTGDHVVLNSFPSLSITVDEMILKQ